MPGHPFRAESPLRPFRRLISALALALAGCGGGGGPGAPAPTPRWLPDAADTWQWQLKGSIDTRHDVAVYDVDLFDTPQATIDLLKGRGTRVVCYFSAGSAEDWRADFGRFTATDLGQRLDGWPGERWLDTRSANVRAIMKTRLDRAAARGCDGVEPDNMDAFANPSGLSLDATTQRDFNRFIAAEAHARGLTVGLKNDIDQLAALEPQFDFAVNEQCHEFDECDGYRVFTARGKPVFNAEYLARWAQDPAARAMLCAASRAAGLRTLVLALALDDSVRHSCD